ncbi:unnamed protein product [Heligmosomoides polygyrus]|uniref:KH domain-containing protein n=1 Tax=Heligmosomoides polygyrus TaxID=6339 RepID=A0A3P8AN42_HELPZ|nr:unnamed protein product [Heligmosomoides polygyrus]
MKREHQSDDDRYNSSRNSKRQRADGFSEALAQGKFELRVLVSSKCAGAIIGKGGENIKRLRTQVCFELLRRCKSVYWCKWTISRNILPRIEDNERDKFTIRLLVHQSHAGALIGRQGTKIKELRDRTNARIKVFQQCCPQSTDRIAMISGDERNVVDAVEQIVEELKQIPIKGPVNPYTSFNYDPALAPDYGGFSPTYPASGRGAPPPVSPFVTIPSDLGGTIIGRGGDRINRIRDESGAQIQLEPSTGQEERVITITGTQAQIHAAQYLLQQWSVTQALWVLRFASIRGGG